MKTLSEQAAEIYDAARAAFEPKVPALIELRNAFESLRVTYSTDKTPWEIVRSDGISMSGEAFVHLTEEGIFLEGLGQRNFMGKTPDEAALSLYRGVIEERAKKDAIDAKEVY